jgi:hypothetical protein
MQYTIIKEKMNQHPSSDSKPTPSVMRQVGITMLGLGALALFIGILIQSLTN